jgi:hypothetical protein
MISQIITDLVDYIRGCTPLRVFVDEAPSENEKIPYIIFEKVPDSTTIGRAWVPDDEGENKKIMRTVSFLYSLSIYGMDNDGHKVVYDIAERLFKQLDYSKFTTSGAKGTYTWNEVFGEPYWDELGVVAMMPVYGVFGTLNEQEVINND